jgi:hypothetical protein
MNSRHKEPLPRTPPGKPAKSELPDGPARPPVKNRVVICGSMAFYNQMLEHKKQLTQAGVRVVIPNVDQKTLFSFAEEDFLENKRRSSMEHIGRVRSRLTWAILVLNYDKHGIPDYIGANTFAEIAIAVSHSKSIYLYQGVPAFYSDELTAWQAISLNGDLSQLVAEYGKNIEDFEKQRAIAREEDRQKKLFDM